MKVKKFVDGCRPRLVIVLLVLALHAAALYGMWCTQLRPSPMAESALLVNLVAPAEEHRTEMPTPQPPTHARPRRSPTAAPQARQQLVEVAPVTANENDHVTLAPPAPSSDRPETKPLAAAEPTPAMPLSPASMSLATELSVACPQRSAPMYPAKSRRLGEIGVVVLRVELSETGQVVLASVQSSSGFERLDEAALSAVRNWRCSPAMHQGQPIRASALQPFRFVMQKG